MTLPTAMLGAYVALLAGLSLNGLHRLVLLAGWARRRPIRPTGDPSARPRVVVRIPLFEEVAVVRRVIAAVGAMDWPRDRFAIQVLDDSRDATTDLARAAVAELKAQGLDAVLLHREHRVGFKAGALAAGLDATDAEVVAIFDADFVPAPDFLLRAMPYLGPGVGAVQARWGHLALPGPLEVAQSVLLDGHFALEQPARQALGTWFNFNGTAGLWRAQAIREAGGWQHRTLVEDMDLSYRAWLAGWKLVYLDNLVVPAEVPPDMAAFLQQQRRWAAGTVQAARWLAPPIVRAPVPVRVKLEALHHLFSPLSWPAIVGLVLLLPGAVWARVHGQDSALVAVDIVLFGLALLPFLAWYLMAIVATGHQVGRRVRALPLVLALGLGMSVAQTRAVWDGWRGAVPTFDRTPKRGDAPRATYRATARTGVPELALAAWAATSLVPIAETGNWASLPFVALFVGGLSAVGWSARRGRTPSVPPATSRPPTTAPGPR